MRVFCLIFFLIMSSLAQAKIVRFDVSRTKLKKFSFREACQTMGYKELLLIDAPSNYQVDCMGKLVTALDFCREKFPQDKQLLRGYVDQKKKSVICQMGSSAILGMSCDKKHGKFCQTPKNSCRRLQRIFAHRLNLDHQSVLSEKNTRQLNCYFSASADFKNLLNDPIKLPPR